MNDRDEYGRFLKGIIPFNKGKHLSEETKSKILNSPGRGEKISKTLTGKHMSEETKQKLSQVLKGRIPWNKGIPCSEEQKIKISNAMKGKHRPEEVKKKISATNKGRIAWWNKGKIPWNKGKKGSQTAWNKGIHPTEETRKKMSSAQKGRTASKLTRQKLSEAHKGKKLSEEHKAKLRLITGEQRVYWKGGAKLANARCKARRNRELGFIPLNECTVDTWVGHHMDKEHVLYIPKNIHTSNPHTLNNQESMDKINEIAINWYINYYGLI